MAADMGRQESLPPLHAQWVTELLGGPIPCETQATCEHCAMWPRAGEAPAAASIHFDPVGKCCTYLPNIRNFLVGRILSDTTAAARSGRTTVEKRIAGRLGVTPLGLRQTPVYSLLYDNSERFFGRNRALRCPHYLEAEGRCGIWRHRNSTCATWFCKHVRGKVGHEFWRDSLHPLLLAVEEDLARWCVLELAPTDEVLRALVGTAEWTSGNEPVTGDSLDNRIDEETYARVWGDWPGRERDFFARCAELVTPLAWADIMAIAGPRVRAYAELTRQAYRRLLADDVPPALDVGPIQLVHVREGVARVNSYDSYDPLDVPRAVLELLLYFDGRPTEDALAAIEEERGLRVEPDLLRKMVDFGLLVAARPASSRPRG
jgi:hypothetical protein